MGRTWVTVALVVLFGLIAANFVLDEQRTETQGGAVGRLQGSVILPDKVAKAEQSVFLVKGKDFEATAFLIDNKCGVFGTNAHVADAIGKNPAYLLQADTGKKFEIGSFRMHPDYNLFEHMVDKFGPMLVYGNGNVMTVPVSPGFDVALLYAKGVDCKKPSPLNSIPELHIADDATLNKIKAGDPIALIGFEGFGTTTRDVEFVTLSPRIEVGHVRAMGSSIPQPATHHDPRLRQLVLHRLTTTPGSSGSPILDFKGNVIAINEGMAAEDNEEDYINRERVSMRADLLAEMIGTRDEEIVAKYNQPITDSLNAFTSSLDALKMVDSKFGVKLFQKYGHLKVKLLATDASNTQFGDIVEPLKLKAERGFPAVTIKDKGRYDLIDRTLEANKAYLISAIDYDMYMNFTDKQRADYKKASKGDTLTDRLCPISIGVRREGSKNFSFVRPTQLPYMLIPPSTVARKIQVLAWRAPGCSPNMTSFVVDFTTFKAAPKPQNPAISVLTGIVHQAGRFWFATMQNLKSNELSHSFAD